MKVELPIVLTSATAAYLLVTVLTGGRTSASVCLALLGLSSSANMAGQTLLQGCSCWRR
jgi:hypothetical protein